MSVVKSNSQSDKKILVSRRHGHSITDLQNIEEVQFVYYLYSTLLINCEGLRMGAMVTWVGNEYQTETSLDDVV